MASLAIQFGNRETPIDPTVPGPAAAFAGYAGQVFPITLRAFSDAGLEITPLPTDITWSSQNTNIGQLSATKGMSNSITLGSSTGQTTISVLWNSKAIRGTLAVYCVPNTTAIPVNYDDGTIKGQVIKFVLEPSGPSPSDPLGNTKEIVVGEEQTIDVNSINTLSQASSVNARGSILRMTDALDISGDGLRPIKITSNVGDPIDITKTLQFRNKTINVPIQITIRVADYFGIYTQFGELKNYNFVVQPQESKTVTYGINKDVIKLMVPGVHTNPVRINAVSLDAGQIFLG